jgi:hypothetical protein
LGVHETEFGQEARRRQREHGEADERESQAHQEGQSEDGKALWLESVQQHTEKNQDREVANRVELVRNPDNQYGVVDEPILNGQFVKDAKPNFQVNDCCCVLKSYEGVVAR